MMCRWGGHEVVGRRSWVQFRLVGIDIMMCRWGGHEVVGRRRKWAVSS
jgi:hypothetical protein